MALVFCKYQDDCIAGKDFRGRRVCTILTDCNFKKGSCPFYKSRKVYFYDEFYEMWIKKNGEW